MWVFLSGSFLSVVDKVRIPANTIHQFFLKLNQQFSPNTRQPFRFELGH